MPQTIDKVIRYVSNFSSEVSVAITESSVVIFSLHESKAVLVKAVIPCKPDFSEDDRKLPYYSDGIWIFSMSTSRLKQLLRSLRTGSKIVMDLTKNLVLEADFSGFSARIEEDVVTPELKRILSVKSPSEVSFRIPRASVNQIISLLKLGDRVDFLANPNGVSIVIWDTSRRKKTELKLKECLLEYSYNSSRPEIRASFSGDFITNALDVKASDLKFTLGSGKAPLKISADLADVYIETYIAQVVS